MLGHLTLSCCFFPLLDFWLDLSLPAHYPLCLSPSLAAALVCRCCFPCTDAPMLIAILMKVGPILNRQFKTLATVLSLAFCILIRGWGLYCLKLLNAWRDLSVFAIFPFSSSSVQLRTYRRNASLMGFTCCCWWCCLGHLRFTGFHSRPSPPAHSPIVLYCPANSVWFWIVFFFFVTVSVIFCLLFAPNSLPSFNVAY